MRVRDYISSKLIMLCVTAMGMLFIVFVLLMISVPVSLVGWLAMGVSLLAVLIMGVSYLSAKRKYVQLEKMIEQLEDKYLIGEVLERPTDPMEYRYYLAMKEISRSAIGEVERTKKLQKEYADYVERWVHEVKTPLTACSLLLANNSSPTAIRKELRRADNMMDTILAYARLQTIEKDTQIAKTNLRQICDQAIREEMEILIGNGITVDVEGESEVLTDSKLMIFVLKQLLINCSKYCPACHIMIQITEGAMSIEDNGPGIPAHEIKRVTERGFTGAKWRNSNTSTGMGLYIVSEICKQIQVIMNIDSEEDKYTRFSFQFHS